MAAWISGLPAVLRVHASSAAGGERRRRSGVLTLSIIKADTGGYVGHSAVHPDMVDQARHAIQQVKGDLLIDGQVSWCGTTCR
jgi:hypothetical protein